MLDETENKSLINSNFGWWLLFLIILFIVVRSEITSYNSRQNEDKILSDEYFNIASRLRAAFNISFISQYITTYDETELFKIASEIKDYQKVSDAYRELYSETLYERLQKAFVDSPEKVVLFLAKTKSIGSGAGGKGKVVPKAGELKVGKVAVTLNPVNGLNSNNSQDVLITFKANEEVGIYRSDKVLAWVSKGVRYQTTFAVIDGYLHWYSQSPSQFLVQKSNLITY